MNTKSGNRSRVRGVSPIRIAVAVLAIGGLSASAVAVGTAGAATTRLISSSKISKFGTILVSGGTAVYTLKPSATPCTASCLKIWPEVVLPKGVTKPKAGSGVNAAKLGTIKRAHGVLQVTYAGKPLYWFSGDSSGHVNGNLTDMWGKWSPVVTKAASAGSGSSGGSTAGAGGAGF